MRRPTLLAGAIFGGLTSLLVMAVSYLGRVWVGLPFIPFDLFDWLARVLPGPVIAFGLDSMVRLITSLGLGPIDSTAKRLEQLQGLLLVAGGGVVLGLVVAWAIQRSARSGRVVGAIAGAVIFALVSGMELSLRSAVASNSQMAFLWLAVVTVGWGLLLGTLLDSPAGGDQRQTPETQASARTIFGQSRRSFFRKVGGLVAATFAAWGVGWLIDRQSQLPAVAQAPTLTGTPPSSPLASAPTGVPGSITPTPGSVIPLSGSVAPAPGTRPALTPTDNFYRIDIDALPPVVNGNTWSLQVSGLFDRPRNLTLADLQAYPPVTQPATMSCISNPVGGDLIGTANWKGAPLHVVLADLGLRPDAHALTIQAADGFYESVTLADLQDPRTLLVYAMNDQPLPVPHGFPLRIYIPDRYGMKQPKWITSIEAVAERGSGYWVDRGWSLEARPQIVSVIDQVTVKPENGRVPVGGIAWAGARGIRSVEVQVDSGPWNAATLITPPLGPLTWVQWRYDWPAVSGHHTFTVRATDGTGALQVVDVQDVAPDGATGYDSVTVTI